MTGLDPLALIYLMSVCFLAAIVRGFSGFGFSALLILSTTWVLPPMQAVPIILMLEIIASLQLLPSVWQHIHWPKLYRLVFVYALSTPLGLWALAYLDGSLVRLIISVLILMMSFILLKGYSFKKMDGNALDYSSGFIAGLFNGLATIGGMTIAIIFVSLQLEAAIIRSTLVALFFITDFYAVLISWSMGLINEQVLMIGLMMLPSLFIGIIIGSYGFKKSSNASFKKLILLFLIFLSIIGLARHVIEL